MLAILQDFLHAFGGQGNLKIGIAPLVALGGAQALAGILQSVFSGTRGAKKKYEEAMKQEGGELSNLLAQAKAKYNPNAYLSSEYQQRMNQLRQSQVQGIASAQDRRGGLSTIGALSESFRRGAAGAAGEAEAAQRANFSQLSQATGMYTDQQRRKTNLLGQMYGQKALQQQQGLQNIAGGLGTMAYLSAFGGQGKAEKTLAAAPENKLPVAGYDWRRTPMDLPPVRPRISNYGYNQQQSYYPGGPTLGEQKYGDNF